MVLLSAFITSLVTSFIIFLVLLLVYSILVKRPGNRVIYYPARILCGTDIPGESKARRPWTWMQGAFTATEADVIEIAGLDAAIYITLFTTALKIILYSGVLLLPLLIPLAVTDHNINKLNSNPSTAINSTKLDFISMRNIQSKSSRIWAFLAGVYWLSFVTYWVLLQTYKHVAVLRSGARSNFKAKPEQFTCLVRDIPKLGKNESRSEQVDQFFRQTHPDTYEKCLIVTKLDKPSKVWTKLESAKAKLAHAETVYELSKSKGHPEGTRPQHKTGKFGLYGRKVDSIDYWNEKIKDLTPNLHEEQARSKADGQLGAAVVFFNSRRAAVEASQEKHAAFADRWKVTLAPEPRAVVWENMNVGFYSRLVRAPVVYFMVFLLVVFYMIPIIFVSALTTLETLTKYLPFLKPIVRITVINTVISAFLPQLALILFFMFLPKLLLALSKAEGIVSKEHIERAACGKMYYFVVFNAFIGFTIFGTLFQSSSGLKTLKKAGGLSVSSVVNLFGQSLPPNSSYYITYIALKFFVGYGLEISRLVPLIIYHLKRKYLCKTETERRAAWAPGQFSYMPNVPNDLLVITITLCYAVIAPLILVFAFAYYGIGWFIMRNQALNVYVPDYESNGRFWPHIHNRFLVGLFVAQITALGYFGILKFPLTVLLVPLLFLTPVFAYITHKVYYPAFKHVDIWTASEEVKEVPTLPAIVDAFTPTCLLGEMEATNNNKFEDSKFEDAESQLASRTSSGIVSPADQHPRSDV